MVSTALVDRIPNRLPDVEAFPTKTYISIEGRKIFAWATITNKSIRVGLDLEDLPFDDYVQKAKSLGAPCGEGIPPRGFKELQHTLHRRWYTPIPIRRFSG